MAELPYDYTFCKLCGSLVRIVRRTDGQADHVEFVDELEVCEHLPGLDPDVDAYLRVCRNDKKTVAIVGYSITSCSHAPYDDERVEIWTLNEAHEMPWMKRFTRHFQMHKREYFERDVTIRGNTDHLAWLKEEHDFPIYMQYVEEDIPASVKYPLYDIHKKLMSNVEVGEEKNKKYFTSTMSFMIALAIYEGFERIEIYGVELGDEAEYIHQKACVEFWLGQACARGIDLYFPEYCKLLDAPLYAYEKTIITGAYLLEDMNIADRFVNTEFLKELD